MCTMYDDKIKAINYFHLLTHHFYGWETLYSSSYFEIYNKLL